MKPVTELWTPVLINDGIFKDNYLVSNFGRVKRKHCYNNGNIKYVLVRIIKGKRPVVRMTGGGREYRKSVAKLVLSSFNYREGCECANITYLDGNMNNCYLSNLRYAIDKDIYTNAELDKVVSQKSQSKKPAGCLMSNVKPIVLKSCSTCGKHPCMTGMETLSTDFGATGCNDYEPKEEDEAV